MGRDIVTAGLLGVLAVILVTVGHGPVIRLASWVRAYVRARGYELELARHTAAGLRAELDATQTYATVTIPRADTAGDPPWEPAEPVDYDPGRYGLPVPAWADPYADRYSGYGGNSGSSGSDYHGGELPAAAEDGRAPSAMGGPGPEPYGVTGPAPRPFWDAPEDTALAETWARLEQAWTGHGEIASVPLVATPGPGGAPAAAPPGPGSRLATRFDVELAAECARFIREQNSDVTDYLEWLLGVTW